MNILFITAHPFLPQMYGGMQQSTKALIQAFRARGHQASLLCSLTPDGWVGKLGRLEIKLAATRKYAKDSGQGFPVYRAWFPWEVVGQLIGRIKPDVVVVLARLPIKMALAVQKTGVPFVMMLQDVEFGEHGGDFKELGKTPCVANSNFTAQKYADAFCVNPTVVQPLVFPEKYKVTSTGEYVTFINPHVKKGLELSLRIAESCPDIPFLFQEAWALTQEERRNLKERTKYLPNVIWQLPVEDMRQIYSRTKILLAPSAWEEAFGRVVAEAQISGIPAVASNIGGLPEAVGAGGILLDPRGDVADWVDAIQMLYTNQEKYNEMSALALKHAKENSDTISERVEKVLAVLLSAQQ